MTTNVDKPGRQSGASRRFAADADGAGPAPTEPDFGALAGLACRHATAFRGGLGSAPPRPIATASELRALFDVGMPDEGRNGMAIIEQLAAAAGPGLVGNAGPGFFGWVMGASHPVGVAADWMTAAWGQNAAIYRTSPAAAIAEEVASRWLLELLRLPARSSVGFTSGATMASFICLAAARGEVLRRVGYDLEEGGMSGAPPLTVLLGEEAHASIFSALRYLGFGRANLVAIGTDAEGRMRLGDLERRLAKRSGPKIIVGQAGHINTGAVDPLPGIAALARAHDAWFHVDGAFGLWTRAAPRLRHLCDGADEADSWAVDGHKWLQVPYDSGFAIVSDALAHKRAMDTTASYLNAAPEDGRNPTQYGPELSRRARGFAVWAVIQALGRHGVAAVVEDHCRLAGQLRDRLQAVPGIEVRNAVCLNQLAVAFAAGGAVAAADTLTDQVIAEIQTENTSFVEGATWKGRRIMRVSITSRETRKEDVDRLGRSIVRAWEKVMAPRALPPR